MGFAGKYVTLIVVILAFCSVSVQSETSEADIDQESLKLLLNPNLLRALSELRNASPVAGGPAATRRKRFSPVDSKVTKLKTPKSEQSDDDVPVIRGLAGLSPIELRLLNQKEEQQDDGKLIRTTTEKSRAEKSGHEKKDAADVPIITGTKDAHNPSRQEARAGKSADDENTVVLLNGATAQRVDAPPAPALPQAPFHPPQPPPSVPPPSRGAKTRCQQKKLLLQLDEELAVLRRLNEQREADIARSLSWVDGAGSATATVQQIPNVPLPYFPYVSNLPIYGRSDWTPLPLQPSYEYQVSGNRGPPVAGIYRRTWVPSQLPGDETDCDYEDERSVHNQGGIIVSTPAPNAFRGPGYQQGNLGGTLVPTPAPNNFRGLHGNSGGYGVPTPAPNNFRQGNLGGYGVPTLAPNTFQGPGLHQSGIQVSNSNNFRGPGLHQGGIQVSNSNTFRGPGPHQGNQGGYGLSTSTPNYFRGPGYDDRGIRYPGGYGISPTPGGRRDGYGRAWAPSVPRVQVDDKVAEPENDPAEDEEKE